MAYLMKDLEMWLIKKPRKYKARVRVDMSIEVTAKNKRHAKRKTRTIMHNVYKFVPRTAHISITRL